MRIYRIWKEPNYKFKLDDVKGYQARVLLRDFNIDACNELVKKGVDETRAEVLMALIAYDTEDWGKWRNSRECADIIVESVAGTSSSSAMAANMCMYLTNKFGLLNEKQLAHGAIWQVNYKKFAEMTGWEVQPK